MSDSDDQNKLKSLINKAKIIKITYYVGAVLLFVALIPAAYAVGGYDAAYGAWALAMFISIGSWLLGNRKIRKCQEEAAILLVEINHRSAYQTANRIEFATPFARPPSDSPSYPLFNTVRKYCKVCHKEILPSDMQFDCPKCYYTAHQIHLVNWFKTHNECPNCFG